MLEQLQVTLQSNQLTKQTPQLKN